MPRATSRAAEADRSGEIFRWFVEIASLAARAVAVMPPGCLAAPVAAVGLMAGTARQPGAEVRRGRSRETDAWSAARPIRPAVARGYGRSMVMTAPEPTP